MRNKIMSAAEAVAIIQSGDAICTSGLRAHAHSASAYLREQG
jgi:hypothetical protein